jgi:N-acetylglucosaminyldiphosphoundecaprenol N-acetyl-beta-D-mannosaminyltransferase
MTLDDAIMKIVSFVRSGSSHHVVTVNPEFIMTAQTDHAFRDVLNRASLALPDGSGVIWASRLLGRPFRERVTGVDTVEHLAIAAARNGLSLYLLGAAPGVAARAAEILVSRNPGLRIAGTYSGSPRPEEEREICARIAGSKPDILLVAYGSPLQDLWIARTQQTLGIPVAIGVGGTFDFITGISVRAPRFMQKAGLEWLHRLGREPRRWKRMLALPRFAVAVLLVRLGLKR